MNARFARECGACVALLTICLFAGACSPAALAADFTEMTIDELLGDTITSEQWAKQMKEATGEAEKTRSCGPLIEPMNLLIRNAELFVAPETMTVFATALLKYGTAGELASRVPHLLKFAQMESSPAAIGKFNLGLKLALVYGGASFDELRGLLQDPKADMEWLLPALGKTGGAAALPLLRPFNKPPNTGSTIYAAVLGAAYAGDEAALARILDWYDEDVKNLPRFAFYVAWGLQEKMNVNASKRQVAYCEQRIAQAEGLLDFLGRPCLPRLIERAVRDGSPAITGYLIGSMERAPANAIVDYDALLDHPLPEIKDRVLDRILAEGDAAQRDKTIARLRAMLGAPEGVIRLFAITRLRELVPGEWEQMLAQACARETNQAVHVRMEDLLPR